MEPCYHISKNGENFGPYTASEICARLREGQLTPDDHAWTEGFADWQPLRTVLSSLPPPPSPSPSTLKAKPSRVLTVTLFGVLVAVLSLFGLYTIHAQQELDEATSDNSRSIQKSKEQTNHESEERNRKLQKLNEKESASTSEAQQPKTSRAKPKHYSMGDSFVLGAFSYKIVEAQRLARFNGKLVDAKQLEALQKDQSFQMLNAFQSLAGGNGVQLESKQSYYLVVGYMIRNDGKTSDLVSLSDFAIRDSKGRTYTPSSDLTTELASMSHSPEDFFFKELQPGISKETIQAFELPRDSFDGQLKLIVPEKGLLSSDLVEVSLGQ